MIGIQINLFIESHGFYPKGGGKIKADISPVKEIRPLKVMERGNILRLKGYSGVGNLHISIAERQKTALMERIYSQIKDLSVPVDVDTSSVTTPGQGTFLFLRSDSENSVAGFTSLGERGKKAETVGEEAAAEFLRYYATGAALDPHLSDQIVLYLSICKEASDFSTSCITDHLITNLWVIGLFHEYKYAVEGEIGKPGVVRVN
jgi:RNA 3'-terminal phosphate cyclase (ATP)